MDQLRYALLTEVLGRWKADIIESFLRAEEIDVVLVQESVSHSTQQTTFTPVKIYVLKESLRRARNLLGSFEVEDDTKEILNMANKKKIEAQQVALQKKQTERTIQIVGAVVLVLVVILVAWAAWPEKQPEAAEIPTALHQYDAYPPMTIDVNKQYFATFKMAKGGEFVVQLFPDKAPKTVNSFVFLARDGYFDGVTFHRVLEGFMAQGGDPTGTGTGGPGYYFEYEENDLKFDKAGVVAMANQGARTPTNGSQFFITFGPTEQLNGGYTIFGQVTEGMDVVNGITRRDPEQNPDFQGDVIETITITEQ